METVYDKLKIVQSKLVAPKGQYNSFGKYYYRSCEDIQMGAKPLLEEVGAVLLVSDKIIQKDSRYYVKATARFIDCNTGQEITNSAYAREEETKKGMDSAQITGAASSYARKYALNGLFCIDDLKDSDAKNPDVKNNNDTKQQDKNTKGNSATKQQDKAIEEVKKTKISKVKLAILRKNIKELEVAENDVLTRYSLETLEDVTEEIFPKIQNVLENIRKLREK